MKNKKMKTSFSLFLVFLSIGILGLIPQVSGQILLIYSTTPAFPNLTFTQPVALLSAGDQTNRLFVVDQIGVIYVFLNHPAVATPEVFLDISEKVLFGGEQGLLGLAFHPNFEENGYFYVDYVTNNPRRSIISRFTVNNNDPDQADLSSEQILLEIVQPYANHNGGQLAFGPDGFLYIAKGDGGSQHDPSGNGQNRAVLLGKILRIDVNSVSGGRNYGIPADNPFVGSTQGFRQEIFAFGFRNPWRFSFDLVTGKLFVGDVGQNSREEINIVENGKNYGWDIMEGSLFHEPVGDPETAGLEFPIWEYGRNEGIAVIGGYVYHGTSLQSLQSKYIYGDYGSGRIWALTEDPSGNWENELLIDTSLTISSFGLDAQNELYICAFDGRIHKLNVEVIPEFPQLSIITIGVVFLLILAVIAVAKKGARKTNPS